MKDMNARILLFLAALWAPFLSVHTAQADPDMVDAHILTGWRQEDGRHISALHLTLKNGWKTYWRAPGDAGIPPQFDWRKSRNLAGVQVTWPTPRSIQQSGVRTIGYADSMTLPLTLVPETPGRPIVLDGTIEIGVCKDVCVPVTLRLSQDLGAQPSKRDPRIVAAMAARPFSAKEAGVTRVACSISPIKGGLRLRAEVDLPDTGGQEVAVIETPNPAIWVAQADTARRNGRLVAETDMYHVNGGTFALDRSGLRITVIGEKRAVDIRGCPGG